MNQVEQNAYLGKQKISKLLLKFSIPCILSLLVSALYNIVDQIFIGNSDVGYLGNAATGIVFPVTIIAVAFAWCFGDGTAAYLSICQGQKDTEKAHKCVGSAMTVTLVISLILMAVGYALSEQILRLFGASDVTLPLAKDYFIIILAAFPIYMLSNMINAVIRADGSPAFAMLAMSAGAVINIILDPIFIFALKMGIKGAAYATIIGQAASFVLCIFYLTRTKTFKMTIKSFLPDLKVLSSASRLGASTFITQMSIVVISLVCNIMLFKYGAMSKYGSDIPIAIISIETKVFTVVINIIVGIVLGGQPILGYNYGALNYDRVRQTYRLILAACVAVGLISTILFEACPKAIVSVFGSGDELYYEFGEKTFRIFLSLVTFTGVIKMTSIFFQAVGCPIKAAISSLIRDIVCFVPLVCTLPIALGVEGILYASPIADFCSMLVAGGLTISFFIKLPKENKRVLAVSALKA